MILKPIENLSFYGAYSVSYLPASGDQFSALTDGTLILAPQKFVNKEVGVKWNINPQLLFTAAVYDLNRYNVPSPTPAIRDSLSFRQQQIQGFETSSRLRHARLAVHSRLCLHRRAGDKRHVDDDRAG